jgi:hypothetical protein
MVSKHRRELTVAEQWYYWREVEVLGPFSGRQLVDLAAAGGILPDDIVWKEGVERGVPASQVQHLFPPVPAALATTATASSAGGTTPAVAGAAEPAVGSDSKGATASETATADSAKAKSGWGDVRNAPAGKARAVAGKGTAIVGQDGKTAKYRMKCTVCNYEDSSWKSWTITRGTARMPFYCPKCRKKVTVEIHGHVS